METLEIKTVEQLEKHYNQGNIFTGKFVKINNLDRDGSEIARIKQHFHKDKFMECSYGTQIALINEIIFDSARYSLGRTNFTNPNCKPMLDEFLKKKSIGIK